MRKKRVSYTLEQIYERLCEESESNPTVLYIKQDMAEAIHRCLGFNYTGSYKKADEVAREYDIKLCTIQDLRGNPAKRIKDEIGLTIYNNKHAYIAAINFIRSREARGMDYDLHEWFERYLNRKKK